MEMHESFYGCAQLPLRFLSGRNRHLYPNELRGVVVVVMVVIGIMVGRIVKKTAKTCDKEGKNGKNNDERTK